MPDTTHTRPPIETGDRRDAGRSLITVLSGLAARKTREFADRLVASHAAIPERTMRTKRLSQKLAAVPDGLLVDVINDVVNNARSGDIKSAQFILSAVDIFIDPAVPSMRLLSLYHLSISRGYTLAANIFMSPLPKKKPYGEYDFVEGRDMDYLTLGEKRSLARTHVKDRLDRLLYDTSPLVVRNLLENPTVTLRDILKMVSRRPNSENVLATVYRSDRWVSSYEVKCAIVRNPYTPVALALGLLFFLKEQDLREVSTDKGLHDVITDTARALLARRGSKHTIGNSRAHRKTLTPLPVRERAYPAL